MTDIPVTSLQPHALYVRYHAYRPYNASTSQETSDNATFNATNEVMDLSNPDADGGINPYMIGIPVALGVFLFFTLAFWFCVFIDRRRRLRRRRNLDSSTEQEQESRMAAHVPLPLPTLCLTSNNKVGVSSLSTKISRRHREGSSAASIAAVIVPAVDGLGAGSESGDSNVGANVSSSAGAAEDDGEAQPPSVVSSPPMANMIGNCSFTRPDQLC